MHRFHSELTAKLGDWLAAFARCHSVAAFGQISAGIKRAPASAALTNNSGADEDKLSGGAVTIRQPARHSTMFKLAGGSF
ncbi:MAG: hypothetical protein KBA71_04055 [Opitutaceae bacterium]|nr:hypothetical protein [Opitutaceae bacterium]